MSQFFENRLAPDRWHSDLLEKMTLEVPGIRQPLIARDLDAFDRFLVRLARDG